MPVIGRILGVISIPELLPVLDQYVDQLPELMVVVLPHSSLISHIIHGSACFAFKEAQEAFYPSVFLLVHLYYTLCQMCSRSCTTSLSSGSAPSRSPTKSSSGAGSAGVFRDWVQSAFASSIRAARQSE